MLSANGEMREVNHRLLKGRKIYGSLGRLWKRKKMPRNVKRALYDGVVIPTIM